MIILTFLISSITSLIFYPFVKSIGIKYNITDLPNKRKFHNKAKVNIGGVSIYLSFLITIFFIWFSYVAGIIENPFREKLIIIFVSSSIIFLIGLLDDLFSLSPFTRLISFFSIGTFYSCKYFLGADRNIELNLFDNFEKVLLIVFVSILIVAVINAINWIDGLDGLATGTLLINFFTLMYIANYFNQSNFLMLISSIIGTLLITLYYNYKPAKIFIGDGGAYFLGFLLVSFSLLMFQDYYIGEKIQQNIFSFFPILVILSLPLCDMFFVIVQRLSKGNSPFYPDRNHLHHILLNRKINYEKILFIYYFLTAAFSFVAIKMIKNGFNIFNFSAYFCLVLTMICLRIQSMENISLKNLHKFKKNLKK